MLNLRILILVFMTFCISVTKAVDVPQNVIARFGDRALLPIEGVWMWNSGATVAIESATNGRITLILVDSPDPTMDTPLKIGEGEFGGAAGTYIVRLLTSGDLKGKRTDMRSTNFIVKLTDKGRLSLTPYSTGLKVHLWRLVPYLFRFSVSKDKAPAGLDGAIRIWPPLGTPEFPVIL